ncbi:MAG: SCO family protein [Candidatus Schekmanbacteria bacterium]|nr:SCO family protein [Candidatus Schekmanbacteria bacterium]
MGRMPSRVHPSIVAAVVLLFLALPGTAGAAETLPPELAGVEIANKLGAMLPAESELTSYTGAPVRLATLLAPGKPLVLTLNYYECPMLCSLQLNGLVAGLRNLGLTPGVDFELVTVSIDPREGTQLAAAKRQAYLRELRLPGAEWHFMVGRPAEIDRLAAAVGFGYRYDEKTDQFAHPPAVFFFAPSGRLARVLSGLTYETRDLRFALMEASEGRIGTAVDLVLLSCFHYDATRGRYGPTAMGIMRLACVVSTIIIAVVLLTLWRRERARRSPEIAP